MSFYLFKHIHYLKTQDYEPDYYENIITQGIETKTLLLNKYQPHCNVFEHIPKKIPTQLTLPHFRTL